MDLKIWDFWKMPTGVRWGQKLVKNSSKTQWFFYRDLDWRPGPQKVQFGEITSVKLNFTNKKHRNSVVLDTSFIFFPTHCAREAQWVLFNCAVGKILPHFNSILTFLHFFLSYFLSFATAAQLVAIQFQKPPNSSSNMIF